MGDNRISMEATGTLYAVSDTKQVSDRFSKREFVLELADNPKYPQLVQFQATGARCELLDGMSVGDTVKVEFSLRGREWRSPSGEVKYFNTLDCWKVERVGDAHVAPNTTARMSNDPNDDVPF